MDADSALRSLNFVDLSGFTDGEEEDAEVQRAISLSLECGPPQAGARPDQHGFEEQLAAAMQASIDTALQERSNRKHGLHAPEAQRVCELSPSSSFAHQRSSFRGSTMLSQGVLACWPPAAAMGAAEDAACASPLPVHAHGGAAAGSQDEPGLASAAKRLRLEGSGSQADSGVTFDGAAAAEAVAGMEQQQWQQQPQRTPSPDSCSGEATHSSPAGGAATWADRTASPAFGDGMMTLQQRTPSPGPVPATPASEDSVLTDVADAGAAGAPSPAANDAAGLPAAWEPQTLRRFYRRQRVLWRNGASVFEAQVTSIDARSSPLLYTLDLPHASPSVARSVETTAHSMLLLLEPGERVWCRVRMPSAADGAVGGSGEPGSSAECSGPCGGNSCTVWEEGRVVYTDLSCSPEPVVWVALEPSRAPRLLHGGWRPQAAGGGGCGGGPAVAVPISDVEPRCEVGECSSHAVEAQGGFFSAAAMIGAQQQSAGC